MSGRWLLAALLPALAAAVPATAQAPADPPADREKVKENIAAALKLTRAAAAEYEITVGDDDKPLDLRREPVLQWSNPTMSDIQGNVFLWTRGGRPRAVGSLYQWFSPRARMEHEFHSLAEGPLSARFHGKPAWKTDEPGLAFADVPGAAAPAAGEPQRVLKLKQLAKEFAGTAKYRGAPDDTELRLLPTPVHSYAAPKQGVLNGGLFAFVRGTDPEVFLLIEARGADAASARWRYAVARMTNMAELRLRHRDKQVWSTEPLPWGEVFGRHERAYTAFGFNAIPDFLKDAAAKPE